MVRFFVLRMVALVLILLAAHGIAPAHARSATGQAPEVALPGHVLPAIASAKPVSVKNSSVQKPLTLTIVLRRADPDGFDAYLREVYDPQSVRYHRFFAQPELADAFGPSESAYARVQRYLTAQGLAVVERAPNRLTLTVRGTRAQVERAFAVPIRDFEQGGRRFYANVSDPKLPADIAGDVLSVAGLSDLAQPRAPAYDKLHLTPLQRQMADCGLFIVGGLALAAAFPLGLIYEWALEVAVLAAIPSGIGIRELQFCHHIDNPKSPMRQAIQQGMNNLVSTQQQLNALAASGGHKAKALAPSQKIGIVAFDAFRMSDVQNWAALFAPDPSAVSRLSVVPVNGGVATPGPAQSEVLIDLAAVMSLSPLAPVSYAVYTAPFNTSYQQVFNAMIADGVTVISNSWSDCEDQHSLADVQGIDAVLAQAAAGGISVLNATGDTGSTCLDGTPNTIGVPADSPHATAVGGSSIVPTLNALYGGERYWDGSANVPPTGQGGFGVSRFFPRPSYQNGLNPSAFRSVPDLVASADPSTGGILICQADAGGCPTGLLYGGTSLSAPEVAAMVATLNVGLGHNLGQLNPLLYPLANTTAFHTAAEMGSDFAHVGLGSPNFFPLALAVGQKQTGAPSSSQSKALGLFGLATTDGSIPGRVAVAVLDDHGWPVSGQPVTLTPSPGSHAVVSPASGMSDATSGTVVFTVTDPSVETVSFTARVNGVAIDQQATVQFVAPRAANAGITVDQTSVAANGTSTATVTVTLQDAQGHPTPGKLVTLAQASGHSIITGPSPSVTNGSGQIQFTVTDTVTETVTYTAVDVTDDSAPVPGSVAVDFTNGTTACITTPAAAAPGFALTNFANGFVARNFFFGNINFTGCPGASNPAFDTAGSAFVAEFPTGELYKFGAAGGTVSSANKLANHGPTFGQPVFGKDGKLYATHFSPSDIVEIDPVTGAVVRTVASGFTCPAALAVDPLSGDLFFDDACTGGGSDNPSIWRIQNPGSPNPTVVVYATLPGTPGGGLAFAPDGTLYAVSNAFNNANMPIVRISGTNTPAPHTPVTLSGITADDGSIAIGGTLPGGAAKSLVLHSAGALKLVDITTNPFTTTVLATGTISAGVIGPDGCLYANAHDAIVKLAPTSGGCGFVPTNPSPTISLAATPNTTLAQGSALTLTATIRNLIAPAGTPITFVVQGANPQLKQAVADGNGQATFTYTGALTGLDFVVANMSLNGTDSTSNLMRVTWTPGAHSTFVSLNLSPSSDVAGRTVTVVGTLSDIGVNPAVPIAGQSVHFTVAGAQCSAVTNVQGIAACQVAPAAPGVSTLTATFGGGVASVKAASKGGKATGSVQLLPSSDAKYFTVVGALTTTVPGQPTITDITVAGGEAFVSFVPPTSTGGSAITGFVVTCTPVGGGAVVSTSGPASPISLTGLAPGVTYTCTVSAVNAAGTGPASPGSNVTAAVGGPGAVAIPTLGEWGLMLLAGMLLVLGTRGAARRRT